VAHRWWRDALCAILSLCGPIAAAQESRLTAPLDAGWRFTQAPDLSGVESAAFDDALWTPVDLPHTWNRIGNDGTERSPLSNNVQGVGWYRLHFKAPHASAGSRYFLQFDAVGALAHVWLNGRYLGKHAGAFSRFRFDASSSIKPLGDNVLVVKADNSRPQPGASTQDIIPLSGDFFVFGGIYRNVSLIITRPVHVDLLDFGGPGLYAHALDIDAAGATVQLSGRVANDLKNPRRIAVEFAIEDAGGAIVASKSLKTTAAVGSLAMQTRLRVEHPRLWEGNKSPYLYRSVMTIRSDTGKILDRVSQPLGFRTVKFDADRGFFLNGEHMFLKGVSMHSALRNRITVLADDERLYDSFREGDFSYRVPLPNGRYRVQLKFEEPTADGLGERVFDVTANDVTKLREFDILKAAGGRQKGVDQFFDAGVDNGVLVLAFRPRRGSALVSALSITPLAPP
jgi:beta-galactosidase